LFQGGTGGQTAGSRKPLAAYKQWIDSKKRPTGEFGGNQDSHLASQLDHDRQNPWNNPFGSG